MQVNPWLFLSDIYPDGIWFNQLNKLGSYTKRDCKLSRRGHNDYTGAFHSISENMHVLIKHKSNISWGERGIIQNVIHKSISIYINENTCIPAERSYKHIIWKFNSWCWMAMNSTSAIEKATEIYNVWHYKSNKKRNQVLWENNNC